MIDCYNYSCNFRRVDRKPTNSIYCDCIACPNRAYDNQTITSNKTLSDEELNKALKERSK